MRRVPLLLPLLLLLPGCADAGGTPAAPAAPPADAFTARAVQVAAAWRAAVGPDAWRTGFMPLEDLTVLAADPGFDDETKQAFGNGWFRAATPLPARVPPDGTIRYADGSQRVPLTSAAQAYAALDEGDPPPCPAGRRPVVTPPPATDPDGVVSHEPVLPCVALTVTKVELGTATVRTSRGAAEVPAWLFTVTELPERIARVAVASSAVVAPPTPADLPPQPAGGLVGAQDLTGADGPRLTYRLGVGACDRDITPLVHETDDVVVVGGSVTTTGEACTAQLVLAPVAVTLRAPLGARPVLDVMGGHLLVQARTP